MAVTAVRCQTILPLARSTASTSKRCSSPAAAPPPATPRPPAEASDFFPVGTAVVRKSLSPAATGVECPRPGISIFQRTFAASLHVSGTFADVAPVCSGPRQCGQAAFAGPDCAIMTTGAEMSEEREAKGKSGHHSSLAYFGGGLAMWAASAPGGA